MYFLTGQRYYICQGNQRLVETGPLRKLGLPENLSKIDAAFVWGHNGLTYFFADTMYWRFAIRFFGLFDFLELFELKFIGYIS